MTCRRVIKKKKVGLSGLPDLPSEGLMIRLKSASEAAHAQGRQYVGSAEGEDIQVNFGPSWTRTPKLSVLMNNGTLRRKGKKKKKRDALDVQGGQQDRVDYLSYANFQDHDFTGASRWSSRKSWTQSI